MYCGRALVPASVGSPDATSGPALTGFITLVESNNVIKPIMSFFEDPDRRRVSIPRICRQIPCCIIMLLLMIGSLIDCASYADGTSFDMNSKFADPVSVFLTSSCGNICLARQVRKYIR